MALFFADINPFLNFQSEFLYIKRRLRRIAAFLHYDLALVERFVWWF